MLWNKTTLGYGLKSIMFLFIVFIPMKTSIYQISFAILTILFLTYLIYYKTLNNLKNLFLFYKDIHLIFSLVIFSMFISNISSHFVTAESWVTLMQYIVRYFLLFWILIFFYAEKIISKQFIVIAIFISLFIQSIDGLHQIFFNIDFIKSHAGSITEGLSGATDNRNVFGFFMSIGASISSVILFNYSVNKLKKMSIIFIIFSLFIFILNLLFSYSRSAWLFYVTFIIFYIIKNLNYWSNKKTLFLLSMITVIGMMFLFSDTLFIRFCKLITMDSSQRNVIWIDAIRLIQENFLFGYGLMTFKHLSSQPISFIHNSFLEILFSLGLFGLLTFTYLLLTVLKEIIKYKNSIYFSFFFAFLIITQFDHSVLKGITSLSTLVLFAFFIFSDRLNKYDKN